MAELAERTVVDQRSAVDPRVVSPVDAQGQTSPARAQAGDSVGNVRGAKERYASWIALIITWTFTGVTVLCLAGMFVLLVTERRDAAEAKTLLEAGVPAFKEICVSLTSLFGPLLAFVLGYYFGEKKSDS